VIQEAELDHCRSQLKKVMSQRDIRVKLEMHQKDLSSKRTQERRLMVKRFKTCLSAFKKKKYLSFGSEMTVARNGRRCHQNSCWRQRQYRQSSLVLQWAFEVYNRFSFK
jgi:hypothetical protein